MIFQILLPASLTSRQRALLHEVAEGCGLAHSSTGEGSQRRLILGDAEVRRDCVSDGDGPIADDALAALLEQHLGAAVRTAFQGSAAQATAAGPGTHGVQARPGKGGNKAQVSGPSSGERSANCGDVPGFAARMQSLLDLEQAAEVSAAEAALDGGGGQGLVLPNLRLTGVEAGLLGRSLLTLVHNKVCGGTRGGAVLVEDVAVCTGSMSLVRRERMGRVALGKGSVTRGESPARHAWRHQLSTAPVQGTPPGPLPVHKFGPHDIVRLRASKAAAGAPVLAEGVVYRLRDDSVVIAGERGCCVVCQDVMPSRSRPPPSRADAPPAPACTLGPWAPPQQLTCVALQATPKPGGVYSSAAKPTLLFQWMTLLRTDWTCPCGWKSWPTP